LAERVEKRLKGFIEAADFCSALRWYLHHAIDFEG